MSHYDATKWYWIIQGAKADTAYSSAAGDYVATSDPAYQNWLKSNNPTMIISEAELGEVLAKYHPKITKPIPAAVLGGYQQALVAGTVIQGFDKAGAPQASDLPNGTWGVIHDTTNDYVYVAYNLNGTIRKVRLT